MFNVDRGVRWSAMSDAAHLDVMVSLVSFVFALEWGNGTKILP